MPIGAAKLGVLGAGLVPGGTETFNAPGTFSIPPGVKKVSVTGTGATGSPGNSGNTGSAGNPGSGAVGGAGGRQPNSPPNGSAGFGGPVLAGTDGNLSSTVIPAINPPLPNVGNTGQAGSAGTAGSAGNPGQSSSGLGNTFPGGAGGNAGAAGNAGNAGNGGQAGSVGSINTGGAGGNGGGSGQGPVNTTFPELPFLGPQTFNIAGAGGGGAGATNDGGSATTSPIRTNPTCPVTTAWWMGPRGGQGGTTSNYSSPIWPVISSPNGDENKVFPGSLPTNVTGGSGGAVAILRNNSQRSPSAPGGPSIGGGIPTAQSNLSLRFIPQQPGAVNPYPLANPASQAIRSGGGGGAGASEPDRYGGGGGGGRGNAGNAGGCGGAGGTGVAATPATFNCVPVTPGGTAPITVASPGGQVVISWNPQ